MSCLQAWLRRRRRSCQRSGPSPVVVVQTIHEPWLCQASLGFFRHNNCLHVHQRQRNQIMFEIKMSWSVCFRMSWRLQRPRPRITAQTLNSLPKRRALIKARFYQFFLVSWVDLRDPLCHTRTMELDHILISGAEVHNLAHVDVRLPKKKLIVFIV